MTDDFSRASPCAIHELQLRKFNRLLRYAAKRSPFYRRLYGPSPGAVASWEEAASLPLVTRADLQQHSRAMVCAPRERWLEICPTTGTTGSSIFIPCTRRDILTGAGQCARSAAALGIGPRDTVYMTYTSDRLQQPAMILAHALRFLVGATLVRAGPVDMELQLKFLDETRPTVLLGLAGLLTKIGAAAREEGRTLPGDFGVRLAVSTGQPLYGPEGANALNRTFRETWGVELYSIYGSTEQCTGMWECLRHRGHHIHWDSFRFDVVDPETGAALPAGATGELVITTLDREGLPFVRYRTGDISRIEEEPCPCGATSPRVMAILGRADEMLKVKGTTVFPQQLEDAALAAPGAEACVIEIRCDAGGLDVLDVYVAARGDEEAVSDAVRRSLKVRCNLGARVTCVPHSMVEARQNRENRVKPRRVWDLRRR